MRGKKGAPNTAVRTAERPGQALNIDICFVPAQHAAQDRLPAVSGSSGRLIVERTHSPADAPDWPGLVFAEAGLAYDEAMRQYAAATRERLIQRRDRKTPELGTDSDWRRQWEGRAERYRVRQQRQQEDRAWQAAKAAWRHARQTFQAGPRAARRAQQGAYQAAQQQWQHDRQQRQATGRQRAQVNQAWHQRNRDRQAAVADTTAARTWIAILVVTDNCTRQCLGLPVFRSGAHLTSEEVVSALRTLLPADLAFLISDQGVHFRSKAFAQLAQEADFVHVPVYRHRPESNGIAERFVLTLKDWLRSKSWQEVGGLEAWLAHFQPDYNERPHQGLAIAGLSPDEFARRIWLM